MDGMDHPQDILTGITVTPVLPRFGAEIGGIDITRPLDPAVRRRLTELQDIWGVTIYRDTGLNDDSHIAFSRLFGTLELAPESATGADLGKPRRRELFASTNLSPDGEINRDPAAALYRAGDRLWHTDSSFMSVRSAYSLLLAHEVPDEGGLTWFADTRSAYEDLPAATKVRLEGLVAEHSLWWSRKLAGAEIDEDEIDARTRAFHPVVQPDSATGRPALYLGAHARDIVGMDRAEGRELIRQLNAWIVRPEYVFYVRWAVGDLVIWNNLVSQHRGGEFDYANARRDMRRTTVRESGVGEPGDDPFGRLFAEMPQLIKTADP